MCPDRRIAANDKGFGIRPSPAEKVDESRRYKDECPKWSQQGLLLLTLLQLCEGTIHEQFRSSVVAAVIRPEKEHGPSDLVAGLHTMAVIPTRWGLVCTTAVKFGTSFIDNQSSSAVE